MTKDTFGESLKRERELRGVTLEEISAATRISCRFLKAIEEEQWEQLPGGVFNRGFVRSFARYLGLNEENTVAEYASAVGDRRSAPVSSGSPPAVAPEQPLLAWVTAAIVLTALLVGAWFGMRLLLSRRAVNGSGPPAAVDAPQQPAPARAPPGGATPSSNGPPGAPSVPPDPVSNAAVNPPAPDPFELKIEAAKRTGVTVVADKDVVFDGTMKAGEERAFSAADHFQVSSDDGGALTLKVNGKTLAPIGPPGQPGKVTLTWEALKGAAGGRN